MSGPPSDVPGLPVVNAAMRSMVEASGADL